MRSLEARIGEGEEVLVIRVMGNDEELREAQTLIYADLMSLMQEIRRREIAREPKPCQGCGEGAR